MRNNRQTSACQRGERAKFVLPANAKAGLYVLAAAIIAHCWASPAAAQLRPGVDKELTASDEWPIFITYYESSKGPESPAIILLHMRNSNRLVWKGGFAGELQKRGFAVVAVDLRKHGESKLPEADKAKGAGKGLLPTDYARMITLDLEAVKAFLLEEHHKKKLNIRKTGIVAPEMSAPLALAFAHRDWMKRPYADAAANRDRTPRGQDIRAIVLLSPEKNLPRINSTKAILALRVPEWEVAFMIGYGKSSAKDRKGKLAKDMHKKLAARQDPTKKIRVYKPYAYSTKYRGTDILRGRWGVRNHMLNFFNEHLKKLPDKWRDRHSRLE